VFYWTNTKKQSFEITFDLEDLDKILALKARVYAWYNRDNKQYYARVTKYLGMNSDGKSNNTCINLTTYIMGLPDGKTYVIHHKNHDSLDNRKFNLDITTTEFNTKHRIGKNSNNTSGYRNVCWLKDENKWCVQLQINGKNTRLGKFSYDELDKAGEFAEQMRLKYYKEYAGNG